MSLESFKSFSESFAEAKASGFDPDKRTESFDSIRSFGTDAFDPDKRIDPNASKLTREDILTVFEGLDEYRFEGKERFDEDEALDRILVSFVPENWEALSDADKKIKIAELCDHISQKLEIKDPPELRFYSKNNSTFGQFSPAENKIYINERHMDDPLELVDTIAHESRHAFQFGRALHPESRLDEMYAANFELYISPEDDYNGYRSQLLESEARAFAAQFGNALIKTAGGEQQWT